MSRFVVTLTAAVVLTAGSTAALAGGAGAATSPGTVTLAGTPVTTAFDLTDSVGVNVHLYYGDTSYADTSRVVTLLQQAGVRHVRDGLPANRPDDVAAIQQLGAAGISSELVLSGTAGPTVDPNQISELQQVAPSVDAVEPTNEYDCSGDTSWAADLHSYSAALVQALQSSPSTQQLGVFAPGFCSPDSVAAYGSVTGTASVANAHDYAAGQAPELSLEGRLPGWSATQQGSLPLALTEAGYHNAINAPAGNPGVSEATAADYTLRTLLDAKRLGVARTYLYELLDEKADTALTDPEQHFGLVRADGTPKPAYYALQNLLADVAPGGATPGSRAAAPYAVSLAGGGSLLRSMVVADPGGTGETVALWLATPLENTTTHQAITDTARTIHVSVGQSVTATSRRPSRGNALGGLGTGKAFDVPVSGAVTLLHLGAPVSGTAASCTSQPSYSTLATQLGASVNKQLGPGAGWTGSPAAGDRAGSTEISADGQQVHVSVPNSPSSWTVAIWERTTPGSANFASFLHASGLPLALLRTYDLASDVPSHVQLSGYGPNGTEMFGQAVPGTWHLVSLTVTPTSSSLAVDGVVVGSAANSAGKLIGLDVGALTPGYRGAVTGLTVFPKALSAANVARLATTAQVTCP